MTNQEQRYDDIAALRSEIERLRSLFKTQSDAHAEHVKGLIAQHEREREIYGQAAQDFRERAERAEAENKRLREALEEISQQDDAEMMLDPTWAKRITSAALKGEAE